MKITPKEDFIIDEEAVQSAYGVTDLLPCPFCGGKWVAITGRVNRETDNAVLDVHCMKGVFECGASMVTCVKNTPAEIDKGKQDLKIRWNKRKV
jgi:hypothetical protein